MKLLRVAVLIFAAAAPAVADSVPEPANYRGEPYRAPVPATLAGATVVDLAGVDALTAREALLLDVLPQVKRPENLPPGTFWRNPPHETIPGAHWLPGTGYQALAPGDEAAFAAALAALSKGDRAHPMVFFCKADCWMSWNAAKRAVDGGYTAVSWFPGGVDDWAAAGRALAPATAYRSE